MSEEIRYAERGLRFFIGTFPIPRASFRAHNARNFVRV